MTDALSLEFSDQSGGVISLEWPAEALLGLGEHGAGDGPTWTLGGELDWDDVECLRIVSGRLEDETLLAVAALRPAGAAGHGEEVVAGALGPAGELARLTETLLSTEFGADGTLRRVGLELYREDGGLPIRVAGDVTGGGGGGQGRVRRVWSELALRSTGRSGRGIIDILSLA